MEESIDRGECLGKKSRLVQAKVFEEQHSENKERDLLWIEITAEDSKLYKRFQFEKSKFKAHLIGKDGGIKKTYTKPFKMNTVYDTIDAMPMRQQEMKDHPE